MSTSGMKSLRFAEFGPPSVLRIEEVAIPEPGEGEALVHISCRQVARRRRDEYDSTGFS